MSQWTHVAGLIRLDSMCYEHEKKDRWIERNKKEILLEGILGPILKWHSWDADEDLDKISKEWDRISEICKLPRGSEGSIEYKIITDFDTESVTAFDIAIYGDLRDFGMKQVSDIQKWFYDTCKELDNSDDFSGVRMATLCVAVEGEGRINFAY